MFLCSHSSPPPKNSCNILFNTCVREKMAELFLVLYLDVQEQCSRILECSSSILYHLCFPNDILMQDLKEVSGETARIIRQYSTQPKLRNWLFVEVTSVSGLNKLCLRKKQVQCVPQRHLLLSSQIRWRTLEGIEAIAQFGLEKKKKSHCFPNILKKRPSLFLTQKSKEMLLSFHFTHMKILVLQ